MDGVVKQLHTECSDHNDAVSCMKYKVLHFLDQVFSKDSFQVRRQLLWWSLNKSFHSQVSENIELVRNSEAPVTSGRSDTSNHNVLDEIENYISTHDVVAKVPYLEGTSVRISPRNLDNDELSVSIKLPTEREGKAVGEGNFWVIPGFRNWKCFLAARKSKLKKILIPLMVFVLLKAMTLIPLAIGVLGLKAWNALQLSFFSFVISVALAIFQLCKKIAADASTAQVATHGPWDNYQAAHYQQRSAPQGFIPNIDAQELAYKSS